MLQMGAQHYQAASQFLAEESRILQKLAGSREDLIVEVIPSAISLDTSYVHSANVQAAEGVVELNLHAGMPKNQSHGRCCTQTNITSSSCPAGGA